MNLWNLGKWPGSVGGSLAGILILAAMSGCARDPEYLHLEGATMGTYYRIVARCPGSDAGHMQELVGQALEAVDAKMSTYRTDSELSRFNAAAAGEWISVSPELMTVMQAAERIHGLSGGAFDVTVGPLVDLWGFGPGGAITRTPTEEELAVALASVGMDRLALDPALGVIRKLARVSVDLSAIAKGFGVDRVSERLAGSGCSDALVDIGGEVRAKGRNPSGRPWRIGIEIPDPEAFGTVQRVVPLTERALATSGDYRNFLDLEDGRRVSHTMDPRAGRPVQHELASVTVLHTSAMWADGWATALNVLGPAAGLAVAESQGLAAILIVRNVSGFEERYTSWMQSYLDARQ